MFTLLFSDFSLVNHILFSQNSYVVDAAMLSYVPKVTMLTVNSRGRTQI